MRRGGGGGGGGDLAYRLCEERKQRWVLKQEYEQPIEALHGVNNRNVPFAICGIASANDT